MNRGADTDGLNIVMECDVCEEKRVSLEAITGIEFEPGEPIVHFCGRCLERLFREAVAKRKRLNS